MYMAFLKGKTVFISGFARGIGYPMVLRFAKEGASITIIGKTVELGPRLSGTIYSLAEEVEATGGKALPLQVDLRDEYVINPGVPPIEDYFID